MVFIAQASLIRALLAYITGKPATTQKNKALERSRQRFFIHSEQIQFSSSTLIQPRD